MDDMSPGNSVQLNSGGPAMTIEAIDDDGSVSCFWFDGGERRIALFPPETIRRL